MKRILSILALVCLVLAMAVPAFAEESYTVRGVWTFHNTLTQYPSKKTEYVNAYFPDDLVTVTEFRFNGKMINLYVASGGYATPLVKDDNSMQIVAKHKVVDFGDTSQIVSADFYSWLIANATPPECDGTTCPATDVNHDDICDDCGAPLTFSLRDDTVYSFNGVKLPTITDTLIETYGYFVILDKGTTAYTLIASNTPIMEQAGKVIVEGSTNLAFLSANQSSTSWSQYSTQTVTGYSLGDTAQVIWTSHNVRNVDNGDQVLAGDTNFMPPLWETMGQVTQGGMVQTTATVVGAMKILALCGVGLIALLVVLSLFGKRSLIPRQ